jgi:AbrB family looped-hinge helix DNA binding protein
VSDSETRVVGERGQITLPKAFREAYGIRGGDEVVVRDEDGTLVIEKAVTEQDLAEGYRRRADRAAELADELDGVSGEADDSLGDTPDW